MTRLSSITKSFGDRTIIDDVSITANPGITALVGLNGCGKTTLFDIISGLIHPDDGSVIFPGNSSLMYLRQNAAYNFQSTVISEIKVSTKLKKNLDDHHSEESRLLKRIESSSNSSSEFEDLLSVQEKISDLEIKIKKLPSPESILSNLGFVQEQFNSPANKLSGGWQMRLALASLISENPDIALIDEPTNYLDLDSIRYFSRWLSNFSGTAIVVSHDRHFLNSVSNEVWELFEGKIAAYRGNYDDYVVQREKNLEQLKKQRKKQLSEMKELQVFIDKNRTNAATAARAQSRIKMLNKLENELVILPPSVPELKINFPSPKKSGKIAVTLENITHFFGDLQLFDDFSTIIQSNRKIAIAGRNGFGKSTLLNVISGKLAPSKGSVIHGHNLEISYFKQDQIKDLPNEITIMEYMERITPMSHFHKINSILASFMFFKESWDKKISVLSGGEKVRLSFIRLILNAGNLIILDEPTTHLDINSRKILITALKKLDSTLIFVSHDTYFTDSLADTVLYFSSPENIEKFEGNLSEFFEHQPENCEEKKSTGNSKNVKTFTDDSKVIDYEIMKKNRNRLNFLERKVCDLEKAIEKEELKRDEFIEKLSSNSADFSKLGVKLKNIEIFLEKLINDWDNTLEKIEVLKNVEQDR